VIGTVQFHGSEPRPIWLPSETLKFTGETVAVHSIARNCALLLVRPVTKVFGPPLQD
jgi:hypothetical protein